MTEFSAGCVLREWGPDAAINLILESDPRVRPVHLRWLTHRFAEAVRLSRGEVVAEMGIGVTPTGRGRGVPVLWSDTGVFMSDAVEGELAEAKVSGWGRVAARIENAKRIAGTYSLLAVTGPLPIDPARTGRGGIQMRG